MTLREIYSGMATSPAPAPWRQVPINVGGITAIGFGADSDWLVVLSHSGIGVIDATTGRVAARSTDDLLHDPYPVSAPGIGPLSGQRIALAGLWGGGLRTTSRDGWVVHRVSPCWPDDCVVLCPPNHPELDGYAGSMLVKDLDPPIRGFGFSDTGRSLTVASTGLFLWTCDGFVT